MPPKTTLHSYFSKAGTAPMRNLTNTGTADADNQTAKPVRKLPSSSLKRKADAAIELGDDEETRRLQKKVRGEKVNQRSRKECLQDLLGEDTSKEQNFKAIQERFNWLEPKRIKDAAGHRPADKNYDPRTVRVPPEIWQKLSASQKQYWEVKQNYRDVILFFKVGSFYELYEDDAQVGADVLGWKLTLTGVGSCRQVGCPASGLEEGIARLTAAGYKVGRMEQVETAAEAKAKRGPKAMIQRTLMRIHSPATATGAVAADAITLLALWEQNGGGTIDWSMASQSASAKFGFAFVDAAAGKYFVGTAVDDAGRANLSAVLTQVAPKEVIFPRNRLSANTSRKLASPPNPLQLSPTDPSEFAEQALNIGDSSQSLSPAIQKELFGDLQLPDSVKQLGNEALAALAALVKHLRRLHADSELVTSAQMVVPYELYEGALRLDGPTLQNLDLLETQDGGVQGSLLNHLDTCGSAGGRRLLKAWLCRPLCSIPAINARLDAVEELAGKTELVDEFRSKLRHVSDLERSLGRARNAISPPAEALPAWAIKAAQSRRLNALHAAVEGVKAGAEALKVLGEGGGPDLQSALLRSAADAVFSEGAEAGLQAIQGCLEISQSPAKAAKKGKTGVKVEEAVRISSKAIKEEIKGSGGNKDEDEQQMAAEVRVTTRLIQLFLESAQMWDVLEHALSTVDVLCSFAAFSQTADGPTARPVFVEPGTDSEALLDLKALWHPCAVAGAGGSLVPNDLCLGTPTSRGASARSLLLTGPNMGGKSTILRATCCATIMAQMGCWIPAASGCLTPADRIFTRLGAQDRIVAGESTFLVECNETAAILSHATPASLVVLDELGRGTSTFDGYAIARAVLEFLSAKVDCRLLFATHYHPLTTEFGGSSRVQLGHMSACISSSSQAAAGVPCITFLYKLCGGACPKSYGLQVAQLAGIPESTLKVADKAGLQLEQKLKASFEKRVGLTAGELQTMKDAIHSLHVCGVAFS